MAVSAHLDGAFQGGSPLSAGSAPTDPHDAATEDAATEDAHDDMHMTRRLDSLVNGAVAVLAVVNLLLLVYVW